MVFVKKQIKTKTNAGYKYLILFLLLIGFYFMIYVKESKRYRKPRLVILNLESLFFFFLFILK